MFKPSENCYRLVKHFEGYRSTPYKDAAGLLTVGYGHLFTATDYIDREITQEEADSLLEHDLGIAAYHVNKLITYPRLTQAQFDALVSFTFNLGAARLKGSTLRSRINRGETDLASKEFKRWSLCGGIPLLGLVRRRTAEARLFSTGVLVLT